MAQEQEANYLLTNSENPGKFRSRPPTLKGYIAQTSDFRPVNLHAVNKYNSMVFRKRSRGGGRRRGDILAIFRADHYSDM